MKMADVQALKPQYWSFFVALKKFYILFRDGQEVAVVYFRNGYMPQNYTSEQV